MRPNLLLTAILFCLLFTACSENDGPGFDFPELTKDNTIGFTVKTTRARTIELLIAGHNIAIDWGDGNVEGFNKTYMDFITHTYRGSGSYNVKIWSENLVELSVSGLLQPIYSVYVGDCPQLTMLNINSIPDTESLILNSCPVLNILNIGNWESLTSLDIENCPKLEFLFCYTHPNLTSLNVSDSPLLRQLNITYTALNTLSLENYKELNDVICEWNKLKSIRLPDDNKITNLTCNNNELESLENLESPTLVSLDCQKNRLTELDLSYCPRVSWLQCMDNELEEIILSADNEMRMFYCMNNQLSAEMLNTLFTDLPEPYVKYNGGSASSGHYNMIQFNGNPGEANCDTSILTDKGWMICTDED